MNSFSIDTMAVSVAEHDTDCSLDYIAIHGSSGTCNQNANPLPLNSRYCGPIFSPVTGAVVETTVCDCTQPFIVDVFTDMLDDLGMMGTTAVPNTMQSRGICLEYMQIPCN